MAGGYQDVSVQGFDNVVGRVDYSKYLLFPYIPGASELMVLCAAIAGADVHPALVSGRVIFAGFHGLASGIGGPRHGDRPA